MSKTFLRTRIFFSLVLLFAYSCGKAQSFDNVVLFTTQNGLSNNSVSCLEKDEDGFLWIGTHEGLNQYDGTEFLNVLSNPKNNLPSNSINKICCINKTTLAISTGAGLCFLNTKTLEGRAIDRPGNKVDGQNTYLAWDILYDKKQKELWVATADGLYVLSDEGKLKRKFESERIHGDRSVFAMCLFKDPDENIFFLSHRPYGFFYPDFDKQKLIPLENKLPAFPLNKLTGNNFRGASFRDNKIICCFSTAKTNKTSFIAYYDNKKRSGFIDSVDKASSNELTFFNAFAVNDSMLIINSYFGEPWSYNINSHRISPAANHPLWFTSWPDGFGVKLLVDKENIWASSVKGLMQIPQHPQIFKTNGALVDLINSNNSLVSYNYGLYHRGKLWLSCLGRGLFSLDTAKGKIEQVFNSNTPSQFSRKVISTDIVEAGDGLLLFSIYGPVAVNTSSLQLNFLKAENKDPLFDDLAGAPLKDSKGNIWISLPSGVTKYSPVTNLFTAYKNRSSGGEFPLEKVACKTEDGNGNIWFARQDSLVKMDPASGKFSVFFLKKNGMLIRPVEAMASDGKDLLYIYLGGAFAIYQISTGSIEMFTKQTGIVSTYINQIVTDKEGNPWIATEGGLVYYNAKTKRFYSYTIADGLPDDNIVSLNFADDKKTTLFLGFPKSYCLVDPDSLLAKRNDAVQNMITGVEVNGNAIAFDETKTFAYRDNSISFFYTGINFKNGRQNSYAYRLEGFEDTWKYCGNKRQCNYINLPPGDYTFKIKSANQQGEWNETPASFSFKIAAPFWQTLWFRILVAMLAALIIYWFIKRRDRFKEKQNKAALQMSELKLTALQSQMNPHFIFNSLNSIQNYILQQKPVDAARYLSKFSKLMRRILDQSFNNLTSLNEIVETLSMYMELEAFRFSNEFTWKINVEDADSINDVKLPPLLLQPYVENAIIHGLMPKEGEKNLMIHLFKKENKLHCVVDDNGVGRSNKLQDNSGHISRGQKLTTDMLATMKQLLHTDAEIVITDKKDEHDNPAGTTVDLVVPLD